MSTHPLVLSQFPVKGLNFDLKSIHPVQPIELSNASGLGISDHQIQTSLYVDVARLHGL